MRDTDARDRGGHHRLHLHRAEDHEGSLAETSSPTATRISITVPGIGAPTEPSRGRIRLFARLHLGLSGAIAHLHAARLAVELEEDVAVAVFVEGAHRGELDDERLALLDLDGELVADLGRGEEVAGGDDRDVGVLIAGSCGTPRRPSGRGRAHHVLLADGGSVFVAQLLGEVVEVARREGGAGAVRPSSAP